MSDVPDQGTDLKLVRLAVVGCPQTGTITPQSRAVVVLRVQRRAIVDDCPVSGAFDPDDQDIASNMHVDRQRIREAATDISFVLVEDPLAKSDLIAAFRSSFESMEFVSFAIEGSTTALARALKSYGHGCRGQVDPYVYRLLSSDAMRAGVPDLALGNPMIDPDKTMFDVIDPTVDYPYGMFDVIDALYLEASLAVALRDGGPYAGMPGADALRLSHDFCTKLIAERYDDFHIDTGDGWCDWFEHGGWDHGWIITDLGMSRVHLLCASGND